MTILNHPKDGDKIHPILIAQGTLGGNFLGVIARLTSYSPPRVIYPIQVNVTESGSWFALFTELPVGETFNLEILNEAGQVVGSASDLTVVAIGAGPQILYPMDQSQVCLQFGAYGIPEDASPLQCHKVVKNADSFDGTPVPMGQGIFAFSFSVPAAKAGPGWTLQLGKESNCAGSSTVSIDINQC